MGEGKHERGSVGKNVNLLKIDKVLSHLCNFNLTWDTRNSHSRRLNFVESFKSKSSQSLTFSANPLANVNTLNHLMPTNNLSVIYAEKSEDLLCVRKKDSHRWSIEAQPATEYNSIRRVKWNSLNVSNHWAWKGEITDFIKSFEMQMNVIFIAQQCSLDFLFDQISSWSKYSHFCRALSGRMRETAREKSNKVKQRETHSWEHCQASMNRSSCMCVCWSVN